MVGKNCTMPTMSSLTGEFPWTEEQFRQLLRSAVKGYWNSRKGQSKSQGKRGVKDAGSRGEVTGAL